MVVNALVAGQWKEVLFGSATVEFDRGIGDRALC